MQGERGRILGYSDTLPCPENRTNLIHALNCFGACAACRRTQKGMESNCAHKWEQQNL